jgi:hypothetical protein
VIRADDKLMIEIGEKSVYRIAEWLFDRTKGSSIE